MEELDEYRIKVLTLLRSLRSRAPLRDFVSTQGQLEWLKMMRRQGWIGVSVKRGVYVVWLTREGRRVLKAFERIYRIV